MNINLYTTSSDERAINKSISSLGSLDVKLKEGSSIINPIFIINKKNYDVAKLNYLYVPSYNRYYFINNINCTTAGLIELECHVDVLMSFKPHIQSITTLINRQEYVYNKYIKDDMLPVRTDRQYNIKNIDSFSAPNGSYFALTINGG